MVRRVPTATLVGLEVIAVSVEASIRRGTPMIQIVGLAPSSARECRERFRAAAAQLGLRVPGLRITVNLAPAAISKRGSAFDLPVSVAILAAAGQVPAERTRRYAMLGELALDGSLRAVRGVLPVALHCRLRPELEGLIVPRPNLRETEAVTDLPIHGATDLSSVLGFLRGESELPPGPAAGSDPEGGGREEDGWPPDELDLADVRGQRTAKRALEIAAAGGHNLLLRGAPGAGKTMLARRLPGLLPPLRFSEAVEATVVRSVAGRLPPGAGLISRRPFRAPHHSITEAGLVGGGTPPRPGEVSLAHHGVLFLDELPEFRRGCLEALRQPLEEGRISVVRLRAATTFPARFMLVAAMNPCPCGRLTEGDHRCTCDPAEVRRYRGRVGGPLLDRIDMAVEVARVPWRELRSVPAGPESPAVRARVRAARERAARRHPANSAHAVTNAALGPSQLRAHCRLDTQGEALLHRASQRMELGARGAHRVLRVARTIADLAGMDRIAAGHVAEALHYRLGAGEEPEEPGKRTGRSARPTGR